MMSSNDIDLSKQFDSKTLLQNLTHDDFEALKEAQRYHYLARNLKTAAWLSLIAGGIILWINASCCQTRTSDYLEIIQGLMLLLWGVWAIAAPSLRTYLVQSFVVLGFAVIELIIAALDGPTVFRSALAIIFVWSAIRIYRYYRQQKLKPLVKPHPSMARLYKLIGSLFREIDFKTDMEAIEFNVKRYRWRGWLFGEYAFFAWKKDRSHVLIVHKPNVQFAPNSEEQLGKKRIEGVFKIGDLVSWGDIPAASLERFGQWKPIDEPSADFATNYYQKQRIPLLLSKAWYGLSALIVIGFLLLMVWFGWLIGTYGS